MERHEGLRVVLGMVYTHHKSKIIVGAGHISERQNKGSLRCGLAVGYLYLRATKISLIFGGRKA